MFSKFKGNYGKVGRPPKDYVVPNEPILKIVRKKIVIKFD